MSKDGATDITRLCVTLDPKSEDFHCDLEGLCLNNKYEYVNFSDSYYGALFIVFSVAYCSLDQGGAEACREAILVRTFDSKLSHEKQGSLGNSPSRPASARPPSSHEQGAGLPLVDQLEMQIWDVTRRMEADSPEFVETVEEVLESLMALQGKILIHPTPFCKLSKSVR